MAQTSEAACLLQSGALYTKRIGLKGSADRLIFAGIKRGAFSLYYDDAPIYHFDLEGRWQRAFLDGIHYRKGLDNAVVSIDRVRDGANLVLKRTSLRYSEVADLDDAIRELALDLIDRIGSVNGELVLPPAGIRPLDRDELRTMLDRIIQWDAAAWFAHRERYLSAYAPLGFLPPDAHQAIVLQATVGDSRGPRFGGDSPVEHAVRTPREFEHHARIVSNLLGRRVLQNNAVFLGEGDVLTRPQEDVFGYFDVIREVFPIREAGGSVHIRERPEDVASLGGVDVFLDNVSPGLPDLAALEALRAKGLRRINIGLESGDTDLRRDAGSSCTDELLRTVVTEAKAAGVALGIILLVGAGGRPGAERHVEATVRLANGLPLGPGDLVYLIDAKEVSSRVLGGGEALTPSETADQTRELRTRLEGVRSKGAKVAPYSMEKQWN